MDILSGQHDHRLRVQSHNWQSNESSSYTSSAQQKRRKKKKEKKKKVKKRLFLKSKKKLYRNENEGNKERQKKCRKVGYNMALGFSQVIAEC